MTRHELGFKSESARAIRPYRMYVRAENPPSGSGDHPTTLGVVGTPVPTTIHCAPTGRIVWD